jgi:hypothetical protein
MRSEQLTEAQIEALHAKVRPTLEYLGRLEQRMVDQQFPEADRLLRMVREAHEAIYSLSVELHYLSCDSGVGRPRRK